MHLFLRVLRMSVSLWRLGYGSRLLHPPAAPPVGRSWSNASVSAYTLVLAGLVQGEPGAHGLASLAGLRDVRDWSREMHPILRACPPSHTVGQRAVRPRPRLQHHRPADAPDGFAADPYRALRVTLHMHTPGAAQCRSLAGDVALGRQPRTDEPLRQRRVEAAGDQ